MIPKKTIKRYLELQRIAKKRFIEETDFCYILDMLDETERKEYDDIEKKYSARELVGALIK